MPNAAAIAAIQSRHRFEREQLADGHKRQHDQLRAMHHERRQRELEGARAHEATPLKRAGEHGVRIRDDAADMRDRVKEHSELDAKQRTERDDMTARHTREIEAERTRPASAAGPDRNSGPSGPGALGAVLDQLSGAQQAEYHALKTKFADQRRELDAKHADAQRRHARYGHASSTSSARDANEAEHRRINEAEERAVEGLRYKFEHELAVTRHRREADGRHAA
jgi:hypothetical protein